MPLGQRRQVTRPTWPSSPQGRNTPRHPQQSWAQGGILPIGRKYGANTPRHWTRVHWTRLPSIGKDQFSRPGGALGDGRSTLCLKGRGLVTWRSKGRHLSRRTPPPSVRRSSAAAGVCPAAAERPTSSRFAFLVVCPLRLGFQLRRLFWGAEPPKPPTVRLALTQRRLLCLRALSSFRGGGFAWARPPFGVGHFASAGSSVCGAVALGAFADPSAAGAQFAWAGVVQRSVTFRSGACRFSL